MHPKKDASFFLVCAPMILVFGRIFRYYIGVGKGSGFLTNGRIREV